MANNINGLKVGLSDIQKLFIGGATWDFDTSSYASTIEVVGDSPTMYLRTEDNVINSEVFSLRAYIYSNNATSSVNFGWDNTRYYYSNLCTIGISYNFTDDRFVCGVSIGSACKNATTRVYMTDGYIYVSLTCQPNIYKYEWHDDDYTGTCWWDAACTDNTSYKTITVRLKGTFYHYNDSHNFNGGYNYSISTANMYF